MRCGRPDVSSAPSDNTIEALYAPASIHPGKGKFRLYRGQASRTLTTLWDLCDKCKGVRDILGRGNISLANTMLCFTARCRINLKGEDCKTELRSVAVFRVAGISHTI